MPLEINSFLESIEQFGSITRVLVALLIVLLGWLVSGGIGQIITAFLDKIRLNQALKRMGWEEALAKAETKLNVSKFFGDVVKWIFVIIFIIVGSEVVGLTGFTEFLIKLLDYIPNIIIAALNFIVAVFLTYFSDRIVLASDERSKISYSKLLGAGIRGTVWTFAILAILLQLGIASDIIRALVYGVVGMVTLAVGLAFGLGGKDLAAEILRELKEKIK
ncbi:MAG: hypothetical protein V1841_01290 [Patescibacteria group bacterium]